MNNIDESYQKKKTFLKITYNNFAAFFRDINFILLPFFFQRKNIYDQFEKVAQIFSF